MLIWVQGAGQFHAQRHVQGKDLWLDHLTVHVQPDLVEFECTTVVVGITSILEFGKLPGNVVINKGEAHMPWRGVINVSQVMSIEKSRIEAEIGDLPGDLMKKVGDGLKLIMELE